MSWVGVLAPSTVEIGIELLAHNFDLLSVACMDGETLKSLQRSARKRTAGRAGGICDVT